jgi:hypothetical protein
MGMFNVSLLVCFRAAPFIFLFMATKSRVFWTHTHTHTHAHARTHAHAHTHARAHAHTHTHAHSTQHKALVKDKHFFCSTSYCSCSNTSLYTRLKPIRSVICDHITPRTPVRKAPSDPTMNIINKIFNVLLTVYLDMSVQQEPTGCAIYFQFISISNLYIFRAGLLLLIKGKYFVYTAVGICHAFILTGCWQDRDGTVLPTARQHKRVTYTNCCIYRVVPPDDEQ